MTNTFFDFGLRSRCKLWLYLLLIFSVFNWIVLEAFWGTALELFLPYASFFIGIYCLIIFFTIHKIPQTLIAIGKTASFSMAAISLFYGVIWIGWLLLKEGLSAFVVHDIGAIFFVLVIFFSRLAPAFFWYEVGKYFRNES